MIQDYSEVTATLNREVTQLINLLNDKKWLEARKKSHEIYVKMWECMEWLDNVEFECWIKGQKK